MGKIYKGDIGTEIILDLEEDLSEAVDITFEVKKPEDDSEVQWSPSVYETRKLKYAVEDGDLDQVGGYRIQAALTLGDWTGRSQTVTMMVYEEFD